AALIGVGVLILALLAALLTSRSRRRRRNAARLEGEATGLARHPARGRGAPRGSHAVRSNRKERQAAAQQGAADPWRSVRVSNGQAATAHARVLPLGQQAPSAAGGPQIARLPRANTRGGAGRAGKRADPNGGSPPWEAAPMPADGPLPLPVVPQRQRPLPAPGAPNPATDALRPPWEDGGQGISRWRDADRFAAAPVPADLPDWRAADAPSGASTGPMYVWNPAAPAAMDPSGPAAPAGAGDAAASRDAQPAVHDEDDPRLP
ncbi:MAG: hypothetical protein JO242_17920, partial [Streptosporangiaceae bacterium]|nr:hypothetical protein [Streptosporangiaceae bacterium]